ncbi:hypothetical protein JB92DRAFT_2837426 [Gautieria morchelliformis]|nr:hypothetical protein JB92DRAFT_2837426 [Gautieria morchelliformis]
MRVVPHRYQPCSQIQKHLRTAPTGRRSLCSMQSWVVLSIVLRDGMRQGLRHDNPLAEQGLAPASEILTQTVDKLAKLGYMRYSIEVHFVFMGFASAFMLKILCPKFWFMMRPGREREISGSCSALWTCSARMRSQSTRAREVRRTGRPPGPGP